MNGINPNITKQNSNKIGVAVVSLISVGLTFGAMTIDSDDLKQQQRIPVFTSISESFHSDNVERKVEVEDRRPSEFEKQEQGVQTEAIESVLDGAHKTMTLMSIITGFMLFMSGILHIVKSTRSEGQISATSGWVLIFIGSLLSVLGMFFSALLRAM